jgi:hypothetical protein
MQSISATVQRSSARRRASQARWLAKPENQGSHRGAEAVARLQAWRAKHPGYSRRPGKSPSPAHLPHRYQRSCPGKALNLSAYPDGLHGPDYKLTSNTPASTSTAPAICAAEIGSDSKHQPKKDRQHRTQGADQHRLRGADAADRRRLHEHRQAPSRTAPSLHRSRRSAAAAAVPRGVWWR